MRGNKQRQQLDFDPRQPVCLGRWLMPLAWLQPAALSLVSAGPR